MSQARRHRRFDPAAAQHKIGHGLREIVLIFFCFMGLYLFVSLLTYYPLDPGWSHSGQVEQVRNKGGVAGALFADVFFYFFGYFAYLFPLMVGYLGVLFYQGKHYDLLAEPRSLIIPGLGFILTLSAGCGLAIVHFTSEAVLLPSHAGGILGMLVGKSLQSIFSQLGATLLLLALFFTGVTLLTGLSWLKLMDFLGFHTLRLMPVVEKYVGQQVFPSLKFISQKIVTWIQILINWIWQAFLFIKGKIALYWQKRQERYEAAYQDEEDDNKSDEQMAKRAVNSPVETDVNPPTLHKVVVSGNVETSAPRSPLVIDNVVLPYPLTNTAVNEIEPILAIAPQDKTSGANLEQQEAQTAVEPMVNAPLLANLNLLNPPPAIPPINRHELKTWLLNGLGLLRIEGEIKAVHVGAFLAGFEVQLKEPLTATALEGLNNSLATALNVDSVKLIELAQGHLAIETPNPYPYLVYTSDLFQTTHYLHTHYPLPLMLGRDVVDEPMLVDFTRLSHLLLAGSDADERDMLLHGFLLGMLAVNTPASLRLLLIDSKSRGLAMYENIPHLFIPLVTEVQQLPSLFSWCVQEMERRYRLMAKKSARNIESYHQLYAAELEKPRAEDAPALDFEELPYLLIVVHELAEMTHHAENSEKIEESVLRLTQKARAAGIHLILASQYPSVNVITGLLKANIPTRIALKVTNKSESRTILGQMGAETLLGHGDMLYVSPNTNAPLRIHGGQLSRAEVTAVLDDLRLQGRPTYFKLN